MSARYKARGVSRRRFTGGAAALALGFLSRPALAQKIEFFRIGTGDTSSSLFAVGSLIAGALSNPPGSRPCDRGGSCGVPNMVAVAQSTEGSVENVRGIASGAMESALVQADVAYWAYHGTGPFRDNGRLADLRAVASLYPAVVHVVVRHGQGLFRVSDLKGKRVSLGPEGSGAPFGALAVLAAYGLGAEDIAPSYLESGEASDQLSGGEIDAFIVVGGVPITAVEDLARHTQIKLIPIEGTPRDEITSFYPFFANAEIDSGTYDRVPYAPTVSVETQFLVTAKDDEELIYQLTRALWHERTRALFVIGHPQARQMLLENALRRIAIPLHPGAKRYYRERGLIN